MKVSSFFSPNDSDDSPTYLLSDELEKVNGKIDCATSDIHWMKIALNEWNEANKNGEHVMAIMEQLSKDDAKQAHVNIANFDLAGRKWK